MKFARSNMVRLLALAGIILFAAIFVFIRSKRLPEQAALRIAHTYIAQRFDWADSAKYDIERVNGFWEVTVTAPQDLPTGTRILSVEINDSGRVTGFM
jgi:hypothetical protein